MALVSRAGRAGQAAQATKGKEIAMKLYSNPLSPFAARVRVAILAKGLSIEVLDPPGGTKSDEYLSMNPMGRVPALVLDNGTVIPESDTIVEYLEDAFPAKSLRPASAEDKAKARLIARVAELYVIAPGSGLFGQMNPATRDTAAVDAAFAAVDSGLTHLNVFLGDGPYAVGDTLTTADCCLAPILFYMGVFSQVFGRADLISKHMKLGAYSAFLQNDPSVKTVLGGMHQALAARMAPAPASVPA
jgi:glutathione S-transferase